jgi:hypothetical protein
MALRMAQRLEHLFNQTVEIKAWNGQDGYGQTVEGVSKKYKVRIERGAIKTSGANQVLVSTHKIIFAEAVLIDPRDVIVLPAAYGTRDANGKFESPDAKILEVAQLSDYRGHISTVVHCGRS